MMKTRRVVQYGVVLVAIHTVMYVLTHLCRITSLESVTMKSTHFKHATSLRQEVKTERNHGNHSHKNRTTLVRGRHNHTGYVDSRGKNTNALHALCVRNALSNQTSQYTDWNSVHTQKDLQSFACSHFMTLSEYLGRTGNQMFQVATLVGTAAKHGYTPLLPRSSPLAEWFDLPNRLDANLTNTRKYKENKCCMYYESIRRLDHGYNWTLGGYFQSWKYFAGVEHVVQNTFKIKSIFLEDARLFLNNVTVAGRSNVCVHYRRGDLQMESSLKQGQAMADLGYIYRAMDYVRGRLPRVQFIVLSDGIFWCRDNIRGDDVIFSPFYRPATDMALMTLCDHVIMTSGSFGWWGAWMSGGLTVYFKGFPTPYSFLDSQLSRQDYYPEHWIGIS